MYKIKPNTLFVGKNIIYLPSCHSTNDVAAEMIQNKAAFEGTVVVTEQQLAGRGQRGATWEATAGQNLTASFVFMPTFLAPMQQFRLSMAVSVALQQLLESYELNAFAKWPNDVMIGTKKTGGVLIENNLQGSRLASSVVGIGLNINQLEFSYPTATSLRKEANQTFEVEQVLTDLCHQLEKTYSQLRNGAISQLEEYYLNSLFRRNEWHRFEIEGNLMEGNIRGISPIGELLVEHRNGQVKTYGFKEIGYII